MYVGRTILAVVMTALWAAAAAAGGARGAAEADSFIKGRLAPPDRGGGAAKIKRVVALDRKVTQKLTAKTVKINEFNGRLDRTTGEFSIGPLPARTYDVFVELEDGKLEGVDIRPVEEYEKQLRDKDRAKITELVLRMKTWSNHKRVLAIGGNSRHATALVELLRTEKTSFHSKKKEPFVVWRVELWHYVKLYGTWRREDDPKILRRFLINTSDFAKWTWNFEPALGGIDLKRGETKRLDFTLPAKFTVKMGRVNGDSGVDENWRAK